MVNVWTTIPGLNVSMSAPVGRGAAASAIGFSGGANYPEIWNDVAWINQPGNNGTSFVGYGAGTTASVIAFGASYGYTKACELWDGTTWSALSLINTSLQTTDGGSGTSTSAAIYAGYTTWNPPGTGYYCETYNGVVWAVEATSGKAGAIIGTAATALQLSSGTTVTKLWNTPSWSNGGTRTSSVGNGLTGSQSAGLNAGGQTTQSWSGTTWSGESMIPSALSSKPGMAGDASEAIAFSGTTAFKFSTQILAAPVANFSGTPTSGLSPLTVVFTDLSTNQPSSWDWDYGDGSTHGTTQNPTHIYTIAGNWTVTLTATNAYGSDAEIKTAYIGVTGSAGPVKVGDKGIIKRLRGQTIFIRQ